MNKDRRLMQRIKMLRKSRDYSIRDIQKYTSIPFSTWAGFERGENKPDYESIKKIIKAFGVSADWLLGLNEKDVDDDGGETEENQEQESQRDGKL